MRPTPSRGLSSILVTPQLSFFRFDTSVHTPSDRRSDQTLVSKGQMSKDLTKHFLALIHTEMFNIVCGCGETGSDWNDGGNDQKEEILIFVPPPSLCHSHSSSSSSQGLKGSQTCMCVSQADMQTQHVSSCRRLLWHLKALKPVICEELFCVVL